MKQNLNKFVTTLIQDILGTTVPNASNVVKFTISGYGTWDDGSTGNKQVTAVNGIATYVAGQHYYQVISM